MPATNNPDGAPVKLDDAARRSKLIGYLQLGLSRAKALRRVGVKDQHTLRTYLERHPEFADELDNAEIDGEMWHLKNWHECAKGDGSKTRLQASMEFLARKYPDDWARKTKHELTGAGGGPIQTESRADLSKLTTDELQHLIELRKKIDRTDADDAADGR